VDRYPTKDKLYSNLCGKVCCSCVLQIASLQYSEETLEESRPKKLSSIAKNLYAIVHSFCAIDGSNSYRKWAVVTITAQDENNCCG